MMDAHLVNDARTESEEQIRELTAEEVAQVSGGLPWADGRDYGGGNWSYAGQQQIWEYSFFRGYVAY
jgi:hypothetical protein